MKKKRYRKKKTDRKNKEGSKSRAVDKRHKEGLRAKKRGNSRMGYAGIKRRLDP